MISVIALALGSNNSFQTCSDAQKPFPKTQAKCITLRSILMPWPISIMILSTIRATGLLRRTIFQTMDVYCHSNGTAYLEVDPATNYAQWVFGNATYTTRFNKVRFDETTQMIYSGDYTFSYLEKDPPMPPTHAIPPTNAGLKTKLCNTSTTALILKTKALSSEHHTERLRIYGIPPSAITRTRAPRLLILTMQLNETEISVLILKVLKV